MEHASQNFKYSQYGQKCAKNWSNLHKRPQTTKTERNDPRADSFPNQQGAAKNEVKPGECKHYWIRPTSGWHTLVTKRPRADSIRLDHTKRAGRGRWKYCTTGKHTFWAHHRISTIQFQIHITEFQMHNFKYSITSQNFKNTSDEPPGQGDGAIHY